MRSWRIALQRASPFFVDVGQVYARAYFLDGGVGSCGVVGAVAGLGFVEEHFGVADNG